MMTFKEWLKANYEQHYNFIEMLLRDETKRQRLCSSSIADFKINYERGALAVVFSWSKAQKMRYLTPDWSTVYQNWSKYQTSNGGNGMNYSSMSSKQLRRALRERGMSGRRPADAKKDEAIEWLKFHDEHGRFPRVGETPTIPAPKPTPKPDIPVVVEPKPATPKGVDSGKVGELANILKDIVGQPEALLDEDKVRKIAEKVATEVITERGSVNITVTTPSEIVKEMGRQHKDFAKILKLLQRPNRKVLLVGPAGSGKTTVVEKCAEALDLGFYPLSVGPQTTETKLLGYKDANGIYHTTPVREAYEKGGVLLLDEFDAGNPGVLTVLNSLLANHVCSFPDGIIQKHKDFRCVASANTYGMGANLVYVGRLKMDGATRDRFLRVTFPYDEGFERDLAGNDEWVSKVQRYRHHADTLGLRVVISPRASIEGALLLEDGFSMKEVEEMTIFEGIDADVAKKLREVS